MPCNMFSAGNKTMLPDSREMSGGTQYPSRKKPYWSLHIIIPALLYQRNILPSRTLNVSCPGKLLMPRNLLDR